jgi:hypothetical protein
MRARLLAGLALTLALATTGCRTRACRPGTVLLALTLDGAAATADQMRITATVDNSTTSTIVVPTDGFPSGNLELPLNGYPAGKELTVTVVARRAGNEVGFGSASRTVSAGCEHIDLHISPPAPCVPTVTSCGDTDCGRISNGCGGFVTCARACMVASVAPTLANTGDTIVLEGTFSQSGNTTIDFPGAPNQPATVLGPARATAKVPATATAGALTVHTGNTASAPFQFRRASYSLDSPDFSFTEPQNLIGRSPGSTQFARVYHTTVNINDHLFVIGGAACLTCTQPYRYIEQVDISVDGSVARSTLLLKNPLAVPRYNHTATVVGGALFVIGGSDGTQPLHSVERALINPDGSLGPFSEKDQPKLLTARHSHTATVIGNYLYVIGGIGAAGDAGTSTLGSIERAVINPDCSLGPFMEYSAALTDPRAGHSAIATSSNLYIFAGSNDAEPLSSAEFAPIEPDGALGRFSISDVAAGPSGRSEGAIEIGGRIFVAGDPPGQPYTRLHAYLGGGKIYRDSVENVLLPLRAGGRLAVARDFVYFTGGQSRSAAETGILRAQPYIRVDPELGPFSDSQRKLNVLRAGPVYFVTDNYLYIIGGDELGDFNTVERATFAPDDSLVDVSPYGKSSSPVRTYAAGFLVSGNPDLLYVAGGNDSQDLDFGYRVELASVDTHGNLGSFAAAHAMKEGRVGAHGVIFDNSGCILGGSGLQSIECLSNGAWTETQPFLLLPRQDFAFIVAFGNWWSIGGGSNPDIEGRIGGAMAVPTTNTAPDQSLGAPSAIQLGNTVYLIGGSKDGSIAFASVNATAFGQPMAYVGATLQPARGDMGVVVIGNKVYAFGGISLDRQNRQVFYDTIVAADLQ